MVRQVVAVLDSVPDGGARAAALAFASGPRQLIVCRSGATARVFLNSCPHRGVRLDWREGDFMSLDGRHLVCATHGALFEPVTGHCVAGPCAGRALVEIPCAVSDGRVVVDDALTPPAAAG
ncbi:MAG: Rieske (2Fe-2S) protein [Gammaproteobacteria bacterium]